MSRHDTIPAVDQRSYFAACRDAAATWAAHAESKAVARLLVTGGAGYVGSHALRALRAAGHQAVVLDDLRSGQAFLAGDAPLVRCDIADPPGLDRAFVSHGPFDGVLHFAACLSVAESVENPLLYYRNNVAGSAVLLDTALRHDVRAFVLSSSCAVYGIPERLPIQEGMALAPTHPYGASKQMVERILADAENAHGLRWAALRYFNAAGADPDGGIGECHQPEIHLIPSALEAAAGLRDALVLFGTDYPTPDGTCVRDYIHVCDLADAHVLAMEALLAGRCVGPRNLGSGRGHSNREILAGVESLTGRPLPLREAGRRPGDPPELVADASRFREEFGWEPRFSDLETLLSTAWRWLREWRQL